MPSARSYAATSAEVPLINFTGVVVYPELALCCIRQADSEVTFAASAMAFSQEGSCCSISTGNERLLCWAKC